MERYISIFFLIVSLSFNANGKDKKSSNSLLNLEKGDIFIYRINNQKISSRKYSEGVISSYNPSGKQSIVQTTRNSDSKLYFEVLEKQNNDCYLFKYRKEYTIYRTKTKNTSRAGDTRFPDYGTRPEAVVQYFLNTVYYHIRFCASTGKLEIENLNLIKKDLVAYLDTRDILDDRFLDNFIKTNLNENRILSDLKFMNYLTHLNDGKNGKIKGEGDELITQNLISRSDEVTSYKFEVENFNMRLGNSFPDNHYTKIGTYTFNNNSGLLINLETSSYLGKERIRTDKLILNRSDIADYSENIELEYYSATCKPTWICGQYKIKGIDKIGLSSKETIIGSETEYMEYPKDSTGYFAIPLEILENNKYTLRSLKTFPSFTGQFDLELYVKPGDSIYVSYDTVQNTFLFSGRGYKDSDVLNRIQLPRHMDNYPFRFRHPEQLRPSSYDSFVERTRIIILEKFQILNSEKNNVSKDFFTYMSSEFNSAQAIMRYYDYWNSFSEEYLKGSNLAIDNKLLILPDLPSCPDYRMLDQYEDYISVYATIRYYLFTYANTGRLPVISMPNYDLDFQKALLSGVPYYLNIGNIMADWISERRKLPLRDVHETQFDEYIENCNHQESRETIIKLINRRNQISIGSERPKVNLLDMNGNSFSWDAAEGKVVVMMLFNDYSREHYFCKDLYEEYGENNKEVLILRISPGITFDSWKSQNERYSKLGYQMFYADGELAFNKQFLTNKRIRSRYLVIDRQGKIFRNPGTIQELKGAIKAALKQAPPPKAPFFETRVGRVLPGIGIGLVLSFMLYRIIVFRRIRKRELKHRLTSLEHKAIKAQLNPHFLFNCLNSIQNLINKDKLNEANDYLTSFAGLIRKILQHSEKDEVSIHEDIETLKKYLELERLRFDFNLNIEIDPSIDIYSTMIPPMLLQPAVENAILHGLDPKYGEKELRIEIVMQSGNILFRIDDDGVGRKASSKVQIESDSKGLDIIKSRIDIMNVNQPDSFSFRVIDKTDSSGKSTGTRVEIVVPDEK